MYLYFIRQVSNKPEDKSPTKIGITKNVNRRLKQLQTGSPCPLEVLDTFYIDSDMKARAVEKACHDILKRNKKHLSGEWFIEVSNRHDLYQRALYSTMGTRVKTTKANRKYERELRESYRQEVALIVEAQKSIDLECLSWLSHHGYA
jgi:hypothetical protein